MAGYTVLVSLTHDPAADIAAAFPEYCGRIGRNLSGFPPRMTRGRHSRTVLHRSRDGDTSVPALSSDRAPRPPLRGMLVA